MVSISLEQRSGQPITTGLLGTRQFLVSLLGGIVFGLWGLWSSYRNGTTRESRENYLREDLEWSETVFSAVLLAAFMMYFLIQAFKIPSGSMRSTLLEGDHLFVNKFIYGVRIPWTSKKFWKLRPIRREDVVVFRFPSESPQEVHCGSPQYGKDFIKRVVGLPGDVVQVRNGMVLLNEKPLNEERYTQYLDPGRLSIPPLRLALQEYQTLWETRKLTMRLGETMRDQFGPVKIPENHYFVMGDNRDRSCDSRFWGPVPESYVKGMAWLIYWPPARMRTVQ
ncbi:MAG: signal peptidase I [Elusimicrobia bacterium]|nr:signal peptidase I [Elusimicrobiota bacterium]